ncbi:hypothetical protein M1O24_02520, partial [Dehalococcoidia bacterium]|nr:hypothetical protein [Dehalococcoidia bacterium]
DEASPQTQANTVRVLSFGKPRIFKNTARIKANAMGYYSLNGKSVISFPQNSKKEKVRDFVRKVRKKNPGKAIIMVLDNFKSHKLVPAKAGGGRNGRGSCETGDRACFPSPLLTRPQSNRIHLEEYQKDYLNNVHKAN